MGYFLPFSRGTLSLCKGGKERQRNQYEELDHKIELKIILNGRIVFRAKCATDWIHGKDADARAYIHGTLCTWLC